MELRLPVFLFCLLSATASAAGDLPATGYSLFDRLFSKPTADGHVYDLPYPFENLLARLRQNVAAYDDTIDSPYVTALIPRGRSLQREAAAPEHFKFPRVVVALDQDSSLPLPTRNRLFLGYQEKANAIEVISYNETAGRFEFQVVDDYGPGLEPRVRYASRDLCTSCHQNRAPIFARPRWRESNFSNEVAELIGEHQERYHGIAALADKGDAARFDFATDQAGLFDAYQRVWQNGCDVGPDENLNRACRAGLFFAVIQHAIASIPRPKYRSALIEENLVPPMRANWQRRWPQGMPVASADIADRKSPGRGEVDRVNSQQDPLSRRPMLASWSYKPALRRSIQGIGEQFLLLQDLVRLNATLLRKASTGDLPQQTLDGHCRLEYTKADAQGRWVNVDCRFSRHRTSGISIEGELWQANYEDRSSGRGKLLVTGTAGWARVEVDGSLEKIQSDRLRFDLSGGAQARAARLWDNRILSKLEIALPATAFDADTRLAATLELSDDFNLVEKAVYAMLEDANDGASAVFDKAPLQGPQLMRALLRKIDADGADYPELALPAGLERHGTATNSGPGKTLPPDSPLRLAYKYCAGCHGSKTRMPPGFLHGDIDRVEAQLRQCAPRIALRLAMWQQHGDERQRSPMPPPAHFDGDAGAWSDSGEYGELLGYVEQLLAPAGGETPQAEDYELLPSCLPARS